MQRSIFFTILLLCIICCQCNLRKAGNNLGAGLKDNADSIGRLVVTGANRGLSDPAVKANLEQLIQAVTEAAGTNAKKQVTVLLDTLFSPRWIAYTTQLVEAATGQTLSDNLAVLTRQITDLRNNLAGAETKQRIELLLTAATDVLNTKLRVTAAGLREELTGAALRSNMAALRDSLLNEKTKASVASIVDSAMLRIAYRMKHDVKDAVGDNASFIEKYAGRLLVLLGVVALVIIIVVWRLKEKYAKTTAVLAARIHKIPDQKVYDELTTGIQTDATLTGVETTLKKVLKANNLTQEGRHNWEQKQMAMRN